MSQAFFSVDHRSLPSDLRGAAVAIGNFDGVHRGHQSVLGAARADADRLGVPTLALTFEPHPRDLFQPDAPVFRLTPPDSKARLIRALGFDGLVSIPFDAALAALTPEAFADEILVRELGLVHAVAGWNFHFGARRAGTPAVLQALGAARGFSVEIMPPYEAEDGLSVSSSRIRSLLTEGALAEAAGLLGWHWGFDGVVVDGDKRGRTIGFPTANIRLPASTQLRQGIYAVYADLDGTRLPGVASWGRRPTFDNGAPVFETFLFDFAGDLYGKTLTVTPISYLRPELKFDGIDTLVAQMNRDADEARQLLTSFDGWTALDRGMAAG